MSLFNERDLRDLAGRARFDRGRRLLDAVDGLDEDEFSLWAYVQGEDDQPYLAMVHDRVGDLRRRCGHVGGASALAGRSAEGDGLNASYLVGRPVITVPPGTVRP